MTFKNKVVLITGGSYGLGAACVRQFEQQGALISILDVAAPPNTGLAAKVITVGDATDAAVRERAVTATLQAFHRIDILVNNVGVGLYESPSNTNDGDLRRLFDVNVFAAVELTKLVARDMKVRRSGWIANVSSISAYAAMPWSMAYCASKAALHSFSESLRREMCAYGIHVCTVIPGIISTGFRDNVIGGSAPAAVLDIRRTVSPDQVAAALIRACARRRRRVFVPWYGQLLAAADLLTPSATDAFLHRYGSPDPASSRASVRGPSSPTRPLP